MITRHILSIPGSGRKVHYRRHGKGPPLLMVHQSPCSSAEYEPLMKQWGEHFTCIAPDTPCFGQSEPLPGNPEIDDFADAIAEFVAAMGIEGCAAYGFHSGGIILVTTVKRHPALFSALAVGGYAVWTEEEMRIFGESYLPPFQPSAYGEHLTWLWNRMSEQFWFFPWFDVRDEARLPVRDAGIERAVQAVGYMLDAGDHYRFGYGAVLRAPRDIPPVDAKTPPVLITAYDGDPLQAHIARLGEMPANWEARAVSTPEVQQDESLAFLREHGAELPAPPVVENDSEGWLAVNGGLIHWKGTRGGKLVLHAPAHELSDPAPGELAIDVPGHGLSDDFDDIKGAIEATAEALDASEIVWPAAPQGDPDRLYPDLTPDRFGAYLQRAWAPARAELFFAPWYHPSAENALAIDRAALAPEAIALRARARLRAGASAARYHDLLTSL